MTQYKFLGGEITAPWWEFFIPIRLGGAGLVPRCKKRAFSLTYKRVSDDAG